jgi:26S proteasome regulatory subunit N10
MPLEATMLVIDNSEYMRNGDYTPTRFGAQSDAVNVTVQTKIDSNAENAVGIMTMAGKGPEVLVTHTKEIGQIIGGVHAAGLKIGGSIDIPTALNVAQLALKHRENKNQRQRVIVFAASPVETDQDTMVKLARKLKKNNIAVDIVAFGDAIGPEGGEHVLRAFVEAVNSSDNSHFVVAPPGVHLLSDSLIASPILSADRSASIPEALGGTGDAIPGPSTNEFEFGVDPSLDPELAMALRISMQEAQVRQAATAADQPASSSTPTAVPPPETTVPSQSVTVPADPTDDEEERMLQEAIALSQQSGKEQAEEDDDEDEDIDMDDEDEEEDEEDDEEDDAINKAIEMSLQKDNDKNKNTKK